MDGYLKRYLVESTLIHVGEEEHFARSLKICVDRQAVDFDLECSVFGVEPKQVNNYSLISLKKESKRKARR